VSDDADALTYAIKKFVSAYFGKVAFQENFISYAQVAKAILDVPGMADFFIFTVKRRF